MTGLAIHTENLSRSFGSLQAVENLTLNVPVGSLFGFLGPNGAGKTTTIRLLLGLLPPSRGQAKVLGFDTVTQAGEIRNRIGVLLDHNGLYERLSAMDNLELYGRIFRLAPDLRQTRIKTLLTHFDLWSRRDEAIGTWSRGMQQKLALARALLHRPALVFLDEPTSGLDPIAAKSVRDDLAALTAQERVTVFLTTHNLIEAEQLCDQVGVLREGKLIATGHPAKLWAGDSNLRMEVTGSKFDAALLSALDNHPTVISAVVEKDILQLEIQPDTNIPTLVRTIVHSGASVEEIRKRDTGLEASFLALMRGENHAD